MVGPRLRHRETEALVANTYRDRGLPWPEPETVNDLDEVDMTKVVAYLAGKPTTGSEVMHLHEVAESERTRALKALFARMASVARDYAAGRLTVPNSGTWQEFKARARRVLDLMASSGKGKRVLAFSSGGLTGMLVGSAMELKRTKPSIS